MHKKDILVIKIALAVGAVARKHHLTPDRLIVHLRQLFPALNDQVLRPAAVLGAAPI